MKTYVYLKDFRGQKAGSEVELDPAGEVAKTWVEAGIIEEKVAAEPDTEAIVEKVAARLFDSFGKGFEKAASKGPRIDPVASEAEKTMSFADQVRQIGILAHPEYDVFQKQTAKDRLEKVYKSSYQAWETKASTQAEGSGPLGGYAVKPEYADNIFEVAVEESMLATKANTITMASNEYRFTKVDQTSTVVAGTVTGYLGGIQFSWAGETRQGNQTNIKLKEGVLKAGELRGFTYVTNEVLADNYVGLESELTRKFGQGIAYYFDLAALVGNGTDTPVPIVGGPATILTGGNTGGTARNTANTIVYADLIAMRQRLLPQSVKTAFWLFNQTTMSALMGMQDGSGRNIWLPNLTAPPAGPAAYAGASRLLDLPYYFTEKTPTLGNPGDALLIDPMGYLVGRRASLEIAASPHVQFLNNMMTYRVVCRIGGQPLLDAPFTMLDGTNKLSHLVQLN